MMKPPLRSQLLIGWIHLCPLLLAFPLIQCASSSPLTLSTSSMLSSPSTSSTSSTLSSPSAIPAPGYFDLRMSALSSSNPSLLPPLSSSSNPSLLPPLSSSSLSSPIPSSSSFMSIPPTAGLSSSISFMRKSWSPLRVVGSRRGKDEKRSISFNEEAMHQYPANEDDDEGRVAKELEKDYESDYNQVLEGRRIPHSDHGVRVGSFGQVATHPKDQGLVGGLFFANEESKDEKQGDEREKDGINEEDSNVVMRKRQSQTGSQSSSFYAGLLNPGFQRKGFLFPSSSFLPSFLNPGFQRKGFLFPSSSFLPSFLNPGFQRKGFLFPSSSFLPSFRVLSSRQSFPSLSRIISGEEKVLPRSSYKQHEGENLIKSEGRGEKLIKSEERGEKLIKSEGRKRALSFFAHWRPVDQVEEQQPFISKGFLLPLTGGSSTATSQETSLIPPITSRGSTIQSRKPALLRWG